MAAQKSVPTPFLTKTYELVDDPNSNDVISWNEDGTAFVVWKTAEFAKDLLPNYFKHNNFSSFVRQLNTYGFRKIVPDKWEFANENFKQGQKELLAEIHRRKTAPSQPSPSTKLGATENQTSPANSGEELDSSSTSSPDSKNPGSLETQASAQLADLTDENEKLRKDNRILRLEVKQTKKQCDELISFLTDCAKVAPDQINRILNHCKPQIVSEAAAGGNGDSRSDFDDDENDDCMKLFGVVLKKKRGRIENIDFSGPHKKEIKRSVELEINGAFAIGEDLRGTRGVKQGL